MEELAALCESEVVAATRDRLASRYRTLIGVEPARRGELRAKLEGIRESGHRSVEDILAALR